MPGSRVQGGTQVNFSLHDYVMRYNQINPLAGIVATRFCILSEGLWSWSNAIIARNVLFLQVGLDCFEPLH